MRSIISKALLLILLTQTSWAIVYNINDDDYITNVSSPSFKYSVTWSTMTPPGTPAAGKGYLYLDTDKKIKFINSDGTIYDLTAATGGNDNLGNHVATTTLVMGGFDITGAGAITATSVTSTATYATNSGQLQGHAASYFATSAGLSSYTPLTLTINEISALSTTYLGILGTAADSSKLNGQSASYYLAGSSASSTYQYRDADLDDLADGTLSKSKVQDSGNWDSAYGWGDHSVEGYLTWGNVGVSNNQVSAGTHTHTGVYLGVSDKAADSDKLDNNDSAYFATTTGLSSEIATRINEISSLTTTYLSSDYISANGTFIRFDPANDGDIQAEISESSMTIIPNLHIGSGGSVAYANGDGELYVQNDLECNGDTYLKTTYFNNNMEVTSTALQIYDNIEMVLGTSSGFA